MLSICAYYLCRAEEQRALRKKARKKKYKEKKSREKKIAKKKKFRVVFEPLRKRTPDQKSSALSIWL